MTDTAQAMRDIEDEMRVYTALNQVELNPVVRHQINRWADRLDAVSAQHKMARQSDCAPAVPCKHEYVPAGNLSGKRGLLCRYCGDPMPADLSKIREAFKGLLPGIRPLASAECVNCVTRGRCVDGKHYTWTEDGAKAISDCKCGCHVWAGAAPQCAPSELSAAILALKPIDALGLTGNHIRTHRGGFAAGLRAAAALVASKLNDPPNGDEQ